MTSILQRQTGSISVIALLSLLCCVSCNQEEMLQFPSYRSGETSSAELIWFALYGHVCMWSSEGVEVGVLRDGTVLKRGNGPEDRNKYHRGVMSRQDYATYSRCLEECVPWFWSVEDKHISEGEMDVIYYCDGRDETAFETPRGTETPPELHRLAEFLLHVPLQNVEIVPAEEYRGFRVLGRGWLAQDKCDGSH